MIHYTIDKKNRIYIYYFVAVVAILITPIINSLIQRIADNQEAFKFIENFHLTGFIIYGLLIFLFSKWIWKWQLISGIPDLNGLWEGQCVRYNPGDEMSMDQISQFFNSNPNENKIKIIIEQDWLKMSLIYEANLSSSVCTVIDLKIENSKVYTFQWIFDSKDRTGITPANKYGIGVSNAMINVLENKDILEGTYFTKTGNKGYFRVQRVKKKKK